MGKQQEAFEKIGAVEQQAELRSAEASRRLGALDLRMSGVQGGLGEHKRDILKLREEVNGLTVKSASHEVDIQKNSDQVRKMEKQRNMDEQNWKAQMDAVHDVLDTKVNEKPFEDLKHCVASLTKGVVKFAQVVGVFPGPRFDDADGVDQSEADVELLGWEECAENMSFRVDKAWRQRCSQRFRNILDMIAKKAVAWLGGVCREYVVPCGQGLAAEVLTEVPKHPGYDRQEGCCLAGRSVPRICRSVWTRLGGRGAHRGSE